jgi:hypothetical protein
MKIFYENLRIHFDDMEQMEPMEQPVMSQVEHKMHETAREHPIHQKRKMIFSTHHVVMEYSVSK